MTTDYIRKRKTSPLLPGFETKVKLSYRRQIHVLESGESEMGNAI